MVDVDARASAGLMPYVPIGEPIPPNVDHAVSVSLPTWQDIVDYEEGRLNDVLQTGYPRFFIHRSIQKLARALEHKFARPAEQCMLFPTAQNASQCRDFIRGMEAKRIASKGSAKEKIPIRIVRFSILPSESQDVRAPCSVRNSAASTANAPLMLYSVVYPSPLYPLAKRFWQHTGAGISSRLAEECLRILAHNQSLLGDCDKFAQPNAPARRNSVSVPARGGGFGRSRYQLRGTEGSFAPLEPTCPDDSLEEELTVEHAVFVEERYGRNLPFGHASRAKLALRRRIAGTLLGDAMPEEDAAEPLVSARAVAGVSENDVYLFSCGMGAIFAAHQTLMLERTWSDQGLDFSRDACMQALRRMEDPSFALGPYTIGKSVCFGFPYTDTLKVLQKWGPGCTFYGHGTDADLDAFEAMLAAQPSDEPRIVSLFCEFPSNPLLRSPDLPRIRKLADKYDFSIVVDETVGNFVNVEVLPYADIVVSSLTKVFSGECNVMGGSLVLNPKGRREPFLRHVLNATYQDSVWPEDAVFLERNSRDFVTRIAQIDKNTEMVADFLHTQMQAPGSTIEAVYYPKFVTTAHYNACRRAQPYGDGKSSGAGFGGLFSVQFADFAGARAFYDNLACAKGPSLGTNCTLACPYTLLAHYSELDWAASMDVSVNLVRVSVGLEDSGALLAAFQVALEAAQRAAA